MRSTGLRKGPGCAIILYNKPQQATITCYYLFLGPIVNSKLINEHHSTIQVSLRPSAVQSMSHWIFLACQGDSTVTNRTTSTSRREITGTISIRCVGMSFRKRVQVLLAGVTAQRTKFRKFALTPPPSCNGMLNIRCAASLSVDDVLDELFLIFPDLTELFIVLVGAEKGVDVMPPALDLSKPVRWIL